MSPQDRRNGNCIGKSYLSGYGFTVIDITVPDAYQLCFQWRVE